MNPNGKSYVCILHEYVQHALKKQPTYKFKELGKELKKLGENIKINFEVFLFRKRGYTLCSDSIN